MDMEAKDAIELIRKHDIAASEISKALNSFPGLVSNAKVSALDKSAAKLFKALTGCKATPQDIKEMTEW